MAQAARSDRGLLTASPTDQMGVQSKRGYTLLQDLPTVHDKDAVHDHAVNMHAAPEPRLDVMRTWLARLYVPGPSWPEGLKQTLKLGGIVLVLAFVCGLLGAAAHQLLFASRAPSCPSEQFRQEAVAEITRRLEERFHLPDLAQVQRRLAELETRLQALEDREAPGKHGDGVGSQAQPQQTQEALEARLQELEDAVQNLYHKPVHDDDMTDPEAGEDEEALLFIGGHSSPLAQALSDEGVGDVREGQGHRSRRSPTQEGNGKKNGKKPRPPKAPKKDFCKNVAGCNFGASFVPKAVHFMSDFWEDGTRKDRFGKEQPIKFLKPAGWMKDIYKKPADQPITSDNGVFTVKKSGLYLIYSSVMFHDNKPRQSQAVVVNGHKLFKCMDSVDYIDTDLPVGNNQAKYKTCAMTGVTHLKENDKLEVQNLYANTEIDLSTDATYFGAVLLNPGETKSS